MEDIWPSKRQTKVLTSFEKDAGRRETRKLLSLIAARLKASYGSALSAAQTINVICPSRIRHSPEVTLLKKKKRGYFDFNNNAQHAS